jgi:hypothetical protein
MNAVEAAQRQATKATIERDAGTRGRFAFFLMASIDLLAGWLV